MISVYIREQRYYSRKELIDLFELTPDEFFDFIKKLKVYGIIKVLRAASIERNLSDLLIEEVGLLDEELQSKDYIYVFAYVGILAFGKRIIKCIPKYILRNEPLSELKQVLHVLRKYNSKKETIHMYNGGESKTAFNVLAVMLYIVENYIENGYYSNTKQLIESNGTGEILWNNTMNETVALVKNNKVYYMELKTSNTTEDESDYFNRLHRCIVAECSNRLYIAGILELFDLDLIAASEEELSDFGDIEYILYRINKELDVQYIDSKKIILKTLYTYIAHSKAFEDSYGLSMYGTNNFNLVWEDVCSKVFNNQLHTEIKNLPLSNANNTLTEDNRTLIEWIQKPKWTKNGSITAVEASKTLIPDLVCIYPTRGNYCFSILDAKYYVINLSEDKVLGQPGVGDITKQYLYQLAFQPFIISQKYEYVQNAFLFPGENKDVEVIGHVGMDMFRNLINGELADIIGVRLPAANMFELYLQDETIDNMDEVLGRL